MNLQRSQIINRPRSIKNQDPKLERNGSSRNLATEPATTHNRKPTAAERQEGSQFPKLTEAAAICFGQSLEEIFGGIDAPTLDPIGAIDRLECLFELIRHHPGLQEETQAIGLFRQGHEKLYARLNSEQNSPDSVSSMWSLIERAQSLGTFPEYLAELRCVADLIEYHPELKPEAAAIADILEGAGMLRHSKVWAWIKGI